jgi:hypothetical protein
VSAFKKATDPWQTVLQRYAYPYHPAGNRTVQQIVRTPKRLLTEHLAGTANEAATVTINGLPAAVIATNGFTASLPVVPARTP